ncbi:pirin family protein [Massilibacteroides sp.]|uniref:pirin family protein n=1 Tax=Massilibacteroides sp. TaxID=2034766 RepID=UPI00262A2224|nr:pirin family protein [Massilibacteroides sp.]MDD4516160.1 pirin family protein [Massilibacteroides sp.]
MKVKNIGLMEFQLPVKSPFIVCFHHKDHFPKGNGKGEPVQYLTDRRRGEDFDHKAPWRMYYGDKVPGFPVHPHRGFETITVMMAGFADHFDSKGSKGRYGEGDVQWMTAGAGVQHSEMFPVLSSEKENPMELYQIWLNLPKNGKFVEPDYKMFWNEQIPVVEDGKARVKIISGSYKNTSALTPPPASWAATAENHVGVCLIDLEPGAEFILPSVSPTLNRMLYFSEGKDISIEGTEVEVRHYAELDGNEEIKITNGLLKSQLLLLEGEPVNEPVAAYGPFVMNTRAEIQEAFAEYEETQFGGWPWDRNDPINPVDSPRFASYRHGEKEERP